MRPAHALIAILPCNDLDASEAFYNRLGFARPESENSYMPQGLCSGPFFSIVSPLNLAASASTSSA